MTEHLSERGGRVVAYQAQVTSSSGTCVGLAPWLAASLVAALIATALGGCRRDTARASTGSPEPRAFPDGEVEVPDELDPDALAAVLDPHIASYGKHWGEAYAFSGFVLIGQHGQPVYARGHGYADREHKTPNDIDTSFRLGSVTKQFVAAAVLKLQEQGKLSVGDRIRKFLPDYPLIGDRINIAHLLSHTSGVPNYTDHYTSEDEPRTTGELLDLFKSRPLEFEPGEGWLYSNPGYDLLGLIIEAAAGRSYGEYFQSDLLRPAGLTRTECDDALGDENRATGYTVTASDLIEKDDSLDMHVGFGAGGMRSTARDLLLWHEALQTDTVLAASSRTQLYRQVRQGYAFGWWVGETLGHRVIEHGGSTNGFMTMYRRFVDEDVVVVVWLNVANQDVFHAMAEAVTRAALGHEVVIRVEIPPVRVGPEEYARYMGHYVLTDKSRAELLAQGMPEEVLDGLASMHVRVVDDRLQIQNTAQATTRIYREKNDRFFTKHADLRMEFVGEGIDHQATSLVIATSVGPSRYTRRGNR